MIKYTIDQFKKDVDILVHKITPSITKYNSIYCVPRGGIALGAALSEKLFLPLVEAPFSKTLIIDDIVDSGKTRKKYPKNDFACIHIKNSNIIPTYFVTKVDNWVKYWWEENDKPVIEDLITRIIEFIGDNPNREGLIKTPKRVAKMYKEVFGGYKNKPPKITCHTRETPGSLITDVGYFYSYCEHHMVPFFGQYYFGYIPDKKEIGASKIGRTIDHYAAKLQVQERLAYESIERICSVAKPLGAILILEGRHLCKEMRGVKKFNSPFGVIEARGILLTNKDGCKDEFLSRIGRRF